MLLGRLGVVLVGDVQRRTGYLTRLFSHDFTILTPTVTSPTRLAATATMAPTKASPGRPDSHSRRPTRSATSAASGGLLGVARHALKHPR